MRFLFKQKTAYEMRISDWSSDVCSSDLHLRGHHLGSRLGICCPVRDVLCRRLDGSRRGDRAAPDAPEHQVPPFQLTRHQQEYHVTASNPDAGEDRGGPRRPRVQLGEAALLPFPGRADPPPPPVLVAFGPPLSHDVAAL